MRFCVCGVVCVASRVVLVGWLGAGCGACVLKWKSVTCASELPHGRMVFTDRSAPIEIIIKAFFTHKR